MSKRKPKLYQMKMIPNDQDQPSKKYSYVEYKELESMMHQVINNYEMLDKFYALYLKYVNDGYPRPIPNCGTCPTSIEKYFERLRDWFVKNGNDFEMQ